MMKPPHLNLHQAVRKQNISGISEEILQLSLLRTATSFLVAIGEELDNAMRF